MPELAEVEFIRKSWNPGLGHRVEGVLLHPSAKVFRDTDTARLKDTVTGATLLSSATAAKQMLFRLSKDAYRGIHLGMTGELTLEAADFKPGKHDHLVLQQKDHALVFSDPRMFGRVQFYVGPQEPEWWTSIA